MNNTAASTEASVLLQREQDVCGSVWDIGYIAGSLPSLHRHPRTFTDYFCFLQQVEDEYVHNTGKSHSLTLHSSCQECRLCTVTLKTFNIWGTGIYFWELFWDHHSSSCTSLTWLSLGCSAEWIFRNALLIKVLHLLSSLMPLAPYLYVRITPHPPYI